MGPIVSLVIGRQPVLCACTVPEAHTAAPSAFGFITPLQQNDNTSASSAVKYLYLIAEFSLSPERGVTVKVPFPPVELSLQFIPGGSVRFG